MGAPTIELQKAVYEALAGDAALTAIVGARILDHAPANVAFPYVTLGRTSLYDWSTATEAGSEMLFTLHVWSKAKGKRETLEILELVRACLHDAALELGGHHVVALRFETADARFDDDLSVHHGQARFRAVTEPAG